MGAGLVAVSDAGPIIHLHEIEQLDLFQIWEQVVIPDAVWKETVGMGRIAQSQLEMLDNLQFVRAFDNDVLQTFVGRFSLDKLHPGEVACLYLCQQRSIHLFLTDDLAARKAAKRLGIQPVGSVGMIVRAWKSGIISIEETKEFLRELQQTSTLFITPEIIEIAIRQLK